MSPSATLDLTEPSSETDRGTLVKIWIKRAKLGPMDERPAARLVADRGLVDNADQGGRRQVTLLDEAAWQRALDDLGVAVDPRERRANLLVRGLPLAGPRFRVLRIGDCRLRVLGETRPCERMDKACPGLKAALSPEWRGGVFAEVLGDGEIHLGDVVRWE